MNSYQLLIFWKGLLILALLLASVQGSMLHMNNIETDPLPDSFSWANQNGITYLGSVYNQNFPQVCNSGWAIATTSALSARVKIRRNATNPDIVISPQVLLNCDDTDHGCLGGEPLSAFRWIYKNNITDQSCQSYMAKGLTNGMKCDAQSKCRFCYDEKCTGQARSKIYGLHKYGSLSGQENIMTEVMRYGPIPCGIATTQTLKKYTNGILNDSSNNTRIDHFVVIYGWGQENKTKYWNVMNSWGTGWGQSGHFRIVRGANNLGIESRCYWAGMTDTWTQDIRNQTYPSQKQSLKREKVFESDIFKGAAIKFLVPSRSSSNINSCQSSWAFATTSMLSDRYYKGTKGLKYIMLSVQTLLNCGVGTCEKGGNPLNALTFIEKYGIPDQSCQNFMAKTPAKESCSAINNCAICEGTINKFQCQAVPNFRRYKLVDYGTLSGSANMKDQLNWGAIVCGIHTTEKFKQYTGGIFSEYSVVTKPNHYVEVVGYGEQGGVGYWLIRNSWGTAWGESGFGKVRMSLNNLGIQNQCFWGNIL